MWDTFILQPMLNGLLFLYDLLFNNFILAIVVFTVLVRAITFPLTYQQQRSAKKLQELQKSEAWKKTQEKYAKDREKLAQEQMKLYQQAGVNPLGGCLPLLIQFPVLIGLYQAITAAMAASPVQLLTLSQHVYPFLPNVGAIIPLENRFLWLNLGLPDPYYILPLIVVATTWLQSKTMTPVTSTDPQAAQMTQTMTLTTTLMIGYFSLQFPSGLSIYWTVANIIGIIQQALTTPVDWKNVFSLRSPKPVEPVKAREKSRKSK
ncbi:MAG: YidC/Oxa1 family membrane protein insertase [Anaerolineales bacterium]